MHADLGQAAAFETVGHKRQLAWRPPIVAAGPLPWWATLRPVAEAVGAPAQIAAVSADTQAKRMLDALVEGFRHEGHPSGYRRRSHG